MTEAEQEEFNLKQQKKKQQRKSDADILLKDIRINFMQEELNLKQQEQEKQEKKSTADKEIQLLKECIKSSSKLAVCLKQELDRTEDGVLKENLRKLNGERVYINYRLTILNQRAELYKDKELFSYHKPYFGNALHYSNVNKISDLGNINNILKEPFSLQQGKLNDAIFAKWQQNLDELKGHLNDVEYSCKEWEIGYFKQEVIDKESERENKYDSLYKNTEIIRKEIHQGSLIESFNQKSEELKQLKKKWYWLFFSVVGCLVVFGITSLTLDSPSDIFNLNSLIQKLSLVLPLIWLAWFAAKRLNVLSKLETDYQFKEATAKTFESYKNEIEALKDDELKKQLLSTVIRNFGDNPVRLFDPKDDKGHTTEELLELAKKLKDITK